jgi:phytol kinase
MITALGFIAAMFALSGLLILAQPRLRRDRELHGKFLVYLVFAMALTALIHAGLFQAFAITIALVGAWELGATARSVRLRWAGLAAYLPLAGAFVHFAGTMDKELLFLVFLNVFLFDGFSQLSGRAFGRTPIAPKISPNKTFEGLLGGLVVATAVNALWLSVSGLAFSRHLVLGLLVPVFAYPGDLLASLYKRRNGVKDFSRLIPYHGGALDRFDSLLVALPMLGLVGLLGPEDPTILRALAYILLIGAVFLLGEALYRLAKLPAEITRKVIHLGSGVVCLSLPFFLEDPWTLLALCTLFGVLLLASKPLGFLPSLDDVRRPSQGSLYFPLAVYLCFVLQDVQGDILYFLLPLLMLTVSDTAAALVGRRWPRHPYTVWGETKTLSGSTAFFLSAAALGIPLLATRHDPITALTLGLSCALAGAVAEAIATRGLDNLSVPLAVVGVYHWGIGVGG